MNTVQYDLGESAFWLSRYSRVWGVESESRAGKWYTVSLKSNGIWGCGCPRWTLNRNRPECKHIQWIKHMLEVKREGEFKVVGVSDAVRRFLNTFAAIEVE